MIIDVQKYIKDNNYMNEIHFYINYSKIKYINLYSLSYKSFFLKAHK